jgi:hypothetical protein
MKLPANLESPFSNTDFSARYANGSWEGEFRIYFKESPREDMGFSISQVDDRTVTNRGDGYFINYPKTNSSQADIPSSWGDIKFPPIDNYNENRKLFCPNVASTISPNNVFVLCASLNTPAIEEDEDDNVVIVSGALGNLINGTGINEKLSIGVFDSIGSPVADTGEDTTEKDGKFTFKPDTKDLKNGRYEIRVQPKSDQYRQLVSTADLIVNPHVLTVEELGAYIGIAAAAIGFVAFLPQIRNYFSNKRQRRNMAKQMDELNDIYDRFTSELKQADSQVIRNELLRKRDFIVTMYKDNQISQEQYSMLDGKISEYFDKLPKQK